MKKFAKISLAAAVAVAGLSSVASAKPLEEAIKGVDATGFVTYQYNDKNSSLPGNTQADKNSDQENIYKAGVTLTVPAADDVAVKVTGVARGTTTNSDANPTTDVVHANFTYTGVQNLTVIAGKQALNTPWTEGSSVINSTQSGTGALALYNAGFATLAAGHFVNNGITGASNGDIAGLKYGAGLDDAKVDVSGADITVAAAIVPVADVATVQVWYASIGKDTGSNAIVDDSTDPITTAGLFTKGGKALSASVDANLMNVAKLNVTHSTLKGKDVDDTTKLDKTNKLTKVTLSGAAGPVNLAAAYAKTGTNGGTVVFDGDASAGFKGFQADLNGFQDSDAWLLSANMNVTDSINVALTHINIDLDAAKNEDLDKAKETYAQLTYNHNKNLSAYVRYGNYTVKEADGSKAFDTDAGRLQVGYKF